MDFAALFATDEARVVGFIGGVFLLVGFLFVVIALIQRGNIGRVKRTYQPIVGRVLHSEVEERSDSEGGAYYPVVSYEYNVNGHRYQSNKLSLGSEVGRGSRSAVERRVSRYIVGQPVQVYYNPNNPTQSVLELKSPSSSLLMFLGLLFIMIVAVIAGVLYIGSQLTGTQTLTIGG